MKWFKSLGLTLPRSLKYLLAAEVLVIGLTGSTCSVTTEPVQVEQACTALAIAVPVIQQFVNLTAAEQQELTVAEQALQECAAGNATTAITTILTEIEQILTNHGTSLAKIKAQRGIK